jgi:hypothetical protein
MRTTNVFPSRFFSEQRSGEPLRRVPAEGKKVRAGTIRWLLWRKTERQTALESTAERGMLKQSDSVN